jgi:tetratricopeptide (TPR) repeat protein
LAGGHQTLGNRFSDAGRTDEAEAEFRRAIALLQPLANADHGNADHGNRLAACHLSLGTLLSRMGKPSEAESEGRAALALYQRLLNDQPKIPDYRNGFVSALQALGDLARRLRRTAEARENYDRALALRKRWLEEDPASASDRGSLAALLRRRGLVHLDLGDPAGSAAGTRRALELFAGLPSRQGKQWFETACCHATLAGLAGRDGAGVSNSEGEQEAARAMVLLRKAVGMNFRGGDAYRSEDALDSLREREDFKKLLAELEQKSAAKPK